MADKEPYDQGKELSEGVKYDVNNFLIIAAVGVLILTCVSAPYTEDGSSGPANTGLWGYGFILIALFGLLIYSYKQTLSSYKVSQSDAEGNGSMASSRDFAIQALLHGGAPGTILFVVLCILALNAQYYIPINKGIVAPEYYTYNTLAIVIIMVQLGALYKLFLSKETKKKGDEPDGGDAASALIYLLSMAGLVTAGIMGIVLKFFSTDG